MRWVGIDEAGYGPNLGPLVMTAVVAEGAGDRPPDLWKDLKKTVARAGGPRERLWVDDSKRIYRAGQGLDRLETGGLVTLAAAGQPVPESLDSLLPAVGAGTISDAELHHWLDDDAPTAIPHPNHRELFELTMAARPLECGSWRIVSVQSVVVGPERFNSGLAATRSKAKVHFAAFAHLLRSVWDMTADEVETQVRADKHGGRHFYLEPLYDTVPDAWIDRGPEGPDRSLYTLREGSRRLELCLQPCADGNDGLVALASMISKWIRELWMGVFNAHWTRRIPDLRPTAGYPGDAARFREAIEPHCRARALDPGVWWREK
jgi:hypothetical protein